MRLPIAMLTLAAFVLPALAADDVARLPQNLKPTFADIAQLLVPPTGQAPAAASGISRATIDAILSSPGHQQSLTSEDVLAAMTRPIQLYDTNGDGLSADELAVPGKIRLAQARAQALSRFLPADLNDDRQVTRAEFDLVVKAGQFFGREGATFDAADTDGNGVLSWEEMEAQQPIMAQMSEQLQRQLAAVTTDVDPTPATNFTLEDARNAAAAVMAAFDRDKNGVLDSQEIAAARAGARPGMR